MQRKAPRLRTKTGCLPCRLGKKKCDETLPTCRRCQAGRRVCERPAEADLADSRCLPRALRLQPSICTATSTARDSRCGNISSIEPASFARRPRHLVGHERQMPELTLNDSALVQGTSARAIETLLSRHFTFGFYELILLPGCSQHFFNGWLAQLCQLAKGCPSLYNSLLACAASHLYMMDGVDTMLQLGLTYYSTAIQQLMSCLGNDEHLRNNDGLLSAIIFLVIHGCQGVGTFADIPTHMRGASQIIQKVLQPTNMPRSELDALTVESVLFHAFHACTGLWSDTGDELPYEFDDSLWTKAESYLSGSGDSPEAPIKLQGPVLGVPTSLLRLAIKLRQLYRSPLSLPVEETQQLRSEGLEWEKKILFDVEAKIPELKNPSDSLDLARDECCTSTTVLYVMAISVLLENLFQDSSSPQTATPVRPWQFVLAAEVLQKHKSDPRWHRSYMGNWPVYTLGVFAPSLWARECMQNDLRKRWTLTKLGQSKRFLDDLEMIWAKTTSI